VPTLRMDGELRAGGDTPAAQRRHAHGCVRGVHGARVGVGGGGGGGAHRVARRRHRRVNVTVLQADEVVTFGAPSPGIAAVVGRGSCSRGACSLTHSLSSSTTSFVYTPPRHHRRDSVHANASLNRGGVLEWKAR
jgi:hypothetical protein